MPYARPFMVSMAAARGRDREQHRRGLSALQQVVQLFLFGPRSVSMIPEKWVPVFREDHAQTKRIERDDCSKKSHLALRKSRDAQAALRKRVPSAAHRARALTR